MTKKGFETSIGYDGGYESGGEPKKGKPYVDKNGTPKKKNKKDDTARYALSLTMD